MAALAPCRKRSGNAARELALPADQDKLAGCAGILPPGYGANSIRQVLVELLLLGRQAYAEHPRLPHDPLGKRLPFARPDHDIRKERPALKQPRGVNTLPFAPIKVDDIGKLAKQK